MFLGLGDIMHVLSLFPTAVGIFNLTRSFSKSEMDCINKFEKRNNMGNLTSADSYIFKKKQLSKLEDFCLDSVGEYIQKIISPKREISVYITQSWLNYTDKNQYHHKHAHPNSLVSGVLYIQADETQDKIHFYNEQYKQIDIPPENHNPFNSKSWWVPVKTGQLIIFPSHLPHSVEHVISDKTRISLSFNTFLSGNLGEENTLTELTL